MNEEKEKRLFSLMAVSRSEVFWRRQVNGILTASAAAPSHRKIWLLAPAAAITALLFFTVGPQAPSPAPDENQLVSAAFLEHLDILDDMDVLEAAQENEL